MVFDVAIAYIAMTHGAPMPYVLAILCTLGIISVFSLSVLGKPFRGDWLERHTLPLQGWELPLD
jgi:hypothetical protein